jgi:hypothetical protein
MNGVMRGALDVEAFIANGFVAVEGAFSKVVAAQARDILWRATRCDPNDRATWKRPVVRLGDHAEPPFREAANSPSLRAALDLIVGEGRWRPRSSLGTFPIRFPSADPPGDDGWHVDMSFGSETTDFMDWRINILSRGRALLMLFLFSDVGPDDAPTRIRVGSHGDIARQLAPAGEAGLSLQELAADGFASSAARPETIAVGEAGTVYLCHPFLVHAAQPHRGTEPKFMAQPPLLPSAPLSLERADGTYSPVEYAIRQNLAAARREHLDDSRQRG